MSGPSWRQRQTVADKTRQVTERPEEWRKKVTRVHNGIKMRHHERKVGLWWLTVNTERIQKENDGQDALNYLFVSSCTRRCEHERWVQWIHTDWTASHCLALRWDRNTKVERFSVTFGVRSNVWAWQLAERRQGESRTEAGRPLCTTQRVSPSQENKHPPFQRHDKSKLGQMAFR